MTSKKVKIVKVPLAPELKNRNISANFPNMPILYLELIENKSKIKPEFVNKEYVPKNKPELEFVEDDEDKRASSPLPNMSPGNSEGEIRENFTEDEDYDAMIENEDENVKEEEDENESEQSERSNRSGESERSHRSEQSEQSDRVKDNRRSRESNGSNFSENGMRQKRKNRSNESDRSRKSVEVHKKGDKRISRRLKELLEGSDDESEKAKVDNTTYTAPSLKELEKSGKFTRKKEIEDVGHTSLTQQEEEDSKRELLFKFELLKKSYKTDSIPEFTIHSDYHHMKKTYESTLRTLSLDKSVEDYKKYLIGGFMLMEFVCGNWLGFDMSGFTQQQIISMNSYEKLLIELGEKSYVPSGSKWPVEVRLLFLVIMNAAFFIISKMILKKTGSNLMNMMNSMNAQSSPPNAPQIVKKRKMKGPSISVDDIPDVNEAEGSVAETESVAN